MKRNLILLLVIILAFLLIPVNHSRAEDLCTSKEDCDAKNAAKQQELQQKQTEREQTEKKKGTIVGTINAVAIQLDSVSGEITRKKNEILSLDAEMKEREKDKADKTEKRNQLLRTWYKRYRVTPLELFLGAGDFTDFAQRLSGYKATVLQGEREINLLNTTLANLGATLDTEQQRKKVLDGEVRSLTTKRESLTAEKTQVEAVLNNITSQITVIGATIASITARQAELIRQKMSATAFFTSIGESEQLGDDVLYQTPPFSPAFAVVSIGYPHRVGMSQYGALGRAKAGQTAETILAAYYQNFSIRKDYSVPGSIKVDGYGEIPFEDNYLFGIAEVPTAWAEEGGYEALKAQAIAARSYALAEIRENSTGSICATQFCQVYKAGKVGDGSAERWRQAVRETRGWVMVDGSGSPIKAYYASTAGGYTRLPTDFDVRWNSSAPFLKRIHDADNQNHPYDGPSYGNSPWFYRAWYCSDSMVARGECSPSDKHPWLNKDEMLDLLNASLIPESYMNSFKPDDPNSQGLSQESNGGWSKDRVKEIVRTNGWNLITDINVSLDIPVQPVFNPEGYVEMLQVYVPGEKDPRIIDGKRFRKVFSLRSRGSLALWSSLYDIIKR